MVNSGNETVAYLLLITPTLHREVEIHIKAAEYNFPISLHWLMERSYPGSGLPRRRGKKALNDMVRSAKNVLLHHVLVVGGGGRNPRISSCEHRAETMN